MREDKKPENKVDETVYFPGTDANGNFLDILEMKKEDGSSKTLYFNINHAAEKMFSESDMKKINKASKKNKK